MNQTMQIVKKGGDIVRRALVLAFCLGFCGLIIYPIINTARQGERVPVFAWLFCAIFLWVTVLAFWRIFGTPRGNLQEWMKELALSDSAVTVTFDNFFQPASVIYDPPASRLYFFNCHVPRRYLAMSDETYSCSIRDICGLYPNTRKEPMVIVTKRGKAAIAGSDQEVRMLFDMLERDAPRNTPGFAADNPMLMIVYVGVALAGIGLGALATFHQGDPDTVVLAMIGGGILGVFSVHLLVMLLAKTSKTDFATPMIYTVKFAFAGMILGNGLVPLIGGDWRPLAGFVLGGMIVGLVYGIFKRN